MFLIRVIFFAIFLLFLSIKNLETVLVAIFLLWIIFYKNILRLNKRVVKSIILFNLGVSIGYVAMSLIKDRNFLEYLFYINLKVYILTLFVFGFFERVNIIKFFAFSKELSYLLTITLSQIISYKKSFEEFRLAYKARVVKRVKEQEKGFIVKVFDIFFNKALKDSKERTLSLRARGFFD